MNGRQSFQQLQADVRARLLPGESTLSSSSSSSSGCVASHDASPNQVELIKICFEALVEKGFIIASEKHKPNRRTVLTLPPKSKGAKNKRHLNVEQTDSRKKRKSDENEDDDDDGDDGNDDDGDVENSEMQRLLRNSTARDAANVFENRRFVGDGEWKEDTGFGPLTEEIVFDEAERLLLLAQEQQLPRANGDLEVAPDEGAATTRNQPSMIFKKEPKTSSVLRKGVNVQSSSSVGIRRDIEGDAEIPFQTVLAEPKEDIRKDEIMWTVGWAQMFVVERENECVKYAKERMQVKAGRIMRILLDTARLRTAKCDVTTLSALSAPMRLPTIFEEYKRTAETMAHGSSYLEGWERDSTVAAKTPEKPLDLPSLRKLLQILTEDRCLTEGNNSSTSSSGDNIEYQANIGEIIHRIKRKTIQSVASQRFGLPAARIVELLIASDELIEQGRMSDMAIMPAREARENLYKLYRFAKQPPAYHVLVSSRFS